MTPICIISGPSAVGKTKVIKHLCEQYGFHKIISVTNRLPREDEVEGIDYYFVSNSEFEYMKRTGQFIQIEENELGKYGYTKEMVNFGIGTKKQTVMDMSTDAYMMLKKKSNWSLVAIFLMPESIFEIENRLRARGERRGIFSEEDVEKRLLYSKKEMNMAKYYDVIFVNKNVEETCRKIVEHLLNVKLY